MQSDLTRRGLIAGSAAALVAASTPGILSAQTAPATSSGGQQGDGFYKFKVGDVDAALVADGGGVFQLAQLFPKADPAALKQAAEEAFLKVEGVPSFVNTLLLRKGSEVILIDTGNGPGSGPTMGKVAPNLKKLGVQPGDVTTVIISHAHPDHIGGLLAGDSLMYPNARIVMNKVEHDFWTGNPAKLPNSMMPEDRQGGMIKTIAGMIEKFKAKLELANPGDTIGGVATLVEAYGHTPGHVMLQVGEGADGLLYWADSFHVIGVQTRHPDWAMNFDADIAAGAAHRAKLLSMVAASRTLITGPHLPFPALGNVRKSGDAYDWVPSLWKWQEAK